MTRFEYGFEPIENPHEDDEGKFRPQNFNFSYELILEFIAKHLEELMTGETGSEYQEHADQVAHFVRWVLVEPFTVEHEGEELLVERHYWMQSGRVVLFIFPTFSITFTEKGNGYNKVFASTLTDPAFIPHLMKILRNLN